MFAALLKSLLILVLILAGLAFLFAGLGGTVPWIKAKGLEAHEIPTGIVILAIAVLLAVYWKVSWSTRTVQSSDAGGKTTRIVERSTHFLR